jgi:FkbM family methyltransferase
MRNPFLILRDRYHPLFHLRKFRVFQSMTRLVDFPVAIHFSPIPHRIYVSLSKNLSFVLSRGEAGENLERRHFAYLCELGNFKRFADVGANIGLYGFLFRTLVDRGFVTMFEPDPRNAQLILRTIQRNGVANVHLLQAAAADANGTLTFLLDDLSGATGSIERGDDAVSFVSLHHRVNPTAITVKSVTLDDIFAEPHDPEFIKIDVEGAELRVLQGSKAVIARSNPAIFFECDENQAQVRDFLASRGYVFFDFTSLRRINTLAHNSLALHLRKHASIIERLSTSTGSVSPTFPHPVSE